MSYIYKRREREKRSQSLRDGPNFGNWDFERRGLEEEHYDSRLSGETGRKRILVVGEQERQREHVSCRHVVTQMNQLSELLINSQQKLGLSAKKSVKGKRSASDVLPSTGL